MTTVPVLCGITSALLHYFMLVFFTWTAVETVWLYIKLVKIIGTQSLENKFMIKAGIPAWGEYHTDMPYRLMYTFNISVTFHPCLISY